MQASHPTRVKKTSLGESLAKSHAYNSIRDSRRDAWRDSWRNFRARQVSRIGLKAWLLARLSPRLVFSGGELSSSLYGLYTAIASASRERFAVLNRESQCVMRRLRSAESQGARRLYQPWRFSRAPGHPESTPQHHATNSRRRYKVPVVFVVFRVEVGFYIYLVVFVNSLQQLSEVPEPTAK